jgi:hypothetical protein
VWIFSGIQYAIVFTILATFGLESFPIFTGIQNILQLIIPNSVSPLYQAITVSVMFFGNLTTAYLFKRVLGSKLVSRVRLN